MKGTAFRSTFAAMAFLLLAPIAAMMPSVLAQSAGEIAFDSNPDFVKLPDGMFLGEVAGVATNSKGHLFVYTRTGAANATVGASRTFYKSGSRLFEFDQTGKFVREIGIGVYGLNFAQAVRVDPQDNIWVVDQGSSNVIKFDPEGRIQLVLSRKPEAISVRPVARGGGPGAAEGRGGAAPGRGAEGRGAEGRGAEGRGAEGRGGEGRGGAAAAAAAAVRARPALPAPESPATASSAPRMSDGIAPATSTSPTA